MNKLFRRIKNINRVQREYFNLSSDEIARRNLQLIRTTSLCLIGIYVIYYLITSLFFTEMRISFYYSLVIPIMVATIFHVKYELKNTVLNIRSTFTFILVFYIVIMLFVIIMSVFPHPELAAIYYPLFVMMAPVMFIVPAYQHIAITYSSLAIFVVMVVLFKDPINWSHELFEAITATLLSTVIVLFMTQLRVQNDSLKSHYYKMSRLDALTETVNKATGTSLISGYVKSRDIYETCALMFVDIDNFKTYNDSFGHLEGDNLLKGVASVLLSQCRIKDVVCRFGGDEFLVLLKDIKSIDVTRAKAISILDAMSTVNISTCSSVTLSIGIYYNEYANVTAGQMIENADQALYYVKNHGKNSFAFYNEIKKD